MNLDTIPRSPSGEFTREKLIDDLKRLVQSRYDHGYPIGAEIVRIRCIEELIESLEMGKLGV